jgi:arabinose-5-phosphate isomerase
MSYLELMKSVLKQEADAILSSSEKISAENVLDLENIFLSLLKNEGSLIFLGVGKSGQIGEKLAATFSSLGLPSFFLHPTEALHGDLGRVKKDDYFVLISKSGSTEELFKLLPFLSNDSSRFIGLIGKTNSILAKRCGLVFDCGVEREACLNNQAPTTSTTVTLSIGDAMAVVFEKVAGLSKEGFAINHPGGLLGKSLLMKVSDIMWGRDKCAILGENANIKDLIVAMTKYNLGGCAIEKEDGDFLGIIVEGDFRRALAGGNIDLNSSILTLINTGPRVIEESALALDALKLMEDKSKSFNILPVTSSKSKGFIGFIRLHDLLKEGFSSSE